MHINFNIMMKLKDNQSMQGSGTWTLSVDAEVRNLDPLLPRLQVSDGSESEAPCHRRAIVLVNLKHPFIVGGGAGRALGMERSSWQCSDGEKRCGAYPRAKMPMPRWRGMSSVVLRTLLCWSDLISNPGGALNSCGGPNAEVEATTMFGWALTLRDAALAACAVAVVLRATTRWGGGAATVVQCGGRGAEMDAATVGMPCGAAVVGGYARVSCSVVGWPRLRGA
jgi:hypothetical protein